MKKNHSVFAYITPFIAALALIASGSSRADQPPLLRLRAATITTAAGSGPRALSLTPSARTDYALVQMSGPIQPSWRAALADSGARVYDYVPDYAYLCRLPADPSRLNSLPFVRSVTPYAPAFRVDPAFAAATGETTAWVSLFPDVSVAAFVAVAEGLGLRATASGDALVTAQGDANALRSLAQTEGVRWIEARSGVKLHNDRSREIMGVNTVWKDLGLYGAGQTVAILDTGLDRGSPKSLSADFAGSVLAGQGLNADDDWADRFGHGTHVAGIIAGRGILSGGDPDLHKYTRSFAGVAPEANLVVQEFDLDPATGRGVGFDLTTDLRHILGWAYDKGARVHNNSWADDDTQFGQYSVHSQQVDQFIWEHPDFVALFGSGNDGKDGLSQKQFLDKLGFDLNALNAINPADLFGSLFGTGMFGDLFSGDPFGDGAGGTGGTGGAGGTGGTGGLDLFGMVERYTQVVDEATALAKGKVELGELASPSTAKNAISVGATEGNRPKAEGWGGYANQVYSAAGFFAEPIASDEMSDNINGMAAFSSRGPTADGRIKPDIVAPGTNIISNRSPLGQDKEYWGVYNTDYAYAGGTSFSTPFASGSAALVREWLQKKQNMAQPSAALVKAVLINGARDITPGQYGTSEFKETGPRPNPVEGWGRVDLAATLDPQGGRSTFPSDYSAGLQTGASATYVYHAEAGSPLAITLAWTDYPGSLTAAQALVNDLNLKVTAPDGSSLLGNGAEDHLNNVEGVDIAAPATGDYTLTVSGANVPQGPQPFALVVSGVVSPVSVPNPPPTTRAHGDLNGDGTVSVADVILALRATVGTTVLSPEQKASADVSPQGAPDGVVNISDAILILKAVAGLITL